MTTTRKRQWPGIPAQVRINNPYRLDNPEKKTPGKPEKKPPYNKRIWTTEEEETAVRLKADGKTYSEISRIMRIDRNNIMRHLQVIAEVERRER